MEEEINTQGETDQSDTGLIQKFREDDKGIPSVYLLFSQAVMT